MTVYFCLFFPWGKLFIHILFVQWYSVPIIQYGRSWTQREVTFSITQEGETLKKKKNKLQRSETVFVTESEQRIGTLGQVFREANLLVGFVGCVGVSHFDRGVLRFCDPCLEIGTRCCVEVPPPKGALSDSEHLQEDPTYLPSVLWHRHCLARRYHCREQSSFLGSRVL